MRRFIAVCTCLAAILTVGCATTTGGDDPRKSAAAVEPLLCAGKEQCEMYWQRSQVWVSSNSGYRIHLATDTVIETFGPLGARVELAYRILRIPDGKGGARITINAGCANIIRCSPTVTDAIIAFKRFVKTGT